MSELISKDEILNVVEETVTAQQFYDWLRNEHVKEIVLEKCEFPEKIAVADAQLDENQSRYLIDKTIKCYKCKFQSVDFSKTQFKQNADFRGATFKHADFSEVEFEKNAYFSEAKFEQDAIFSKAQFKNASFRETKFEKNVYFILTQFEKNVYFVMTQFEKNADFRETQFKQNADFNRSQFAFPADFKGVKYWPNTISQTWCGWFLRFKYLWRQAGDGSEKPRKFIKWLLPKNAPGGKPKEPTDFFLDSQNIEEVTNPIFKRYVADQQYIRAFKQANRFWSNVWRWTSDYGRNLWLWAFESLALAIIFGFIYRFSFPEGFIYTHEQLGRKVGLWSCIYYSIVTFTTLGFGDIAASQPGARVAVAIEVVLGYLMLGGLISIFANKLARRS